MRGKDAFINNKVKNIGITPAYAGKRVCECLKVESVKDHPRLCGEK